MQATDTLTVSVAQAADLLGVGRGSMYQAVRAGIVPALRVGRKPRFRIPRAAIQRLLNDPARFSLVNERRTEET